MPNRRGCVSTVTVPIARKLVWPKSFEALKFRPPDYFRRCLIESASNCYTDIGMRNLSLAEQHGSRGEIDFIHMDAHLAFLNIWVNIVGILVLTSVALALIPVAFSGSSSVATLFPLFPPEKILVSSERNGNTLEQSALFELNSLNWICFFNLNV